MAALCCPVGAPRGALDSLSEARSAGTTGDLGQAAPRAPQGLPATRRLLSPADFSRVLKTGRRRSDACFTIIAAPGTSASPRIGLAVSRKVSRSAVQRNRIKRVVRESFRKHAADMPALDFVVMARPGAAACENPVLATSIDALLERMAR